MAVKRGGYDKRLICSNEEIKPNNAPKSSSTKVHDAAIPKKVGK
jgi:hypothetical protein